MDVFIDIATSYLIVAILMFLIWDTRHNYFNLITIKKGVLITQVILIAGVFLFLTRTRLNRTFFDRNLLLFAAAMVSLFIFSFEAPSVSISLGTLVIMTPIMINSIIVMTAWKNWYQRTKKINRILFIIIALSLIAGILEAIFKVPLPENLYPSINGSGIGNAALFSVLQDKLWGYIFIVGAGFIAIYLSLSFIKPKPILNKISTIFVWALPILVFIVVVSYISIQMIYRTKTFSTPTFDFGLFTQMFYNMAAGRGMMTTLERGFELSHLAVHFSPIYYLILPIFMLIPRPETLQVVQILIFASGVIPLYLIMKEKQTSKVFMMTVLLIYMTVPGLASGTFYDLHENCFLPVILLTLVYFSIKGRWLVVLFFTLLALTVKEDAFLYTSCIGLYLLFTKSDENSRNASLRVYVGWIVLIFSFVWFYIVTSFLNDSGVGVMFWRYNNLSAYPAYGTIGILIGIFQNPSFFLATLFAPTKMSFLVILMAALGFMPLLSRKPGEFILLIPLIVMNLSSNYLYQHQFGYQYLFGSVTLLLYMIILLESDIRNAKGAYVKIGLRIITSLALFGFAVSLITTGETSYARRVDITNYYNATEMYLSMEETLDSIPRDVVVVASTNLTTYIADTYYLYDYDYYILHWYLITPDYLLIDKRIDPEVYDLYVTYTLSNGYIESGLSTEYITVYTKATTE